MHLKFGGGRTSVTDTLDGEKSTQSMQTRLYSVVLAVVRYSERKGTIVEDDIACCKKILSRFLCASFISGQHNFPHYSSSCSVKAFCGVYRER